MSHFWKYVCIDSCAVGILNFFFAKSRLCVSHLLKFDEFFPLTHFSYQHNMIQSESWCSKFQETFVIKTFICQDCKSFSRKNRWKSWKVFKFFSPYKVLTVSKVWHQTWHFDESFFFLDFSLTSSFFPSLQRISKLLSVFQMLHLIRLETIHTCKTLYFWIAVCTYLSISERV